ncbi:hypothetical protein HPB50_002261 [Hyalomma asiaticum]|uniref:Uncharacterized protein n=1 Tax=Hyalomma asiaticum TaxID=266040 RepID=A0ACB7TDT3_HYAAI|nr:hypothetical protein HPB50_002261 [Hyalomma asiaticum]
MLKKAYETGGCFEAGSESSTEAEVFFRGRLACESCGLERAWSPPVLIEWTEVLKRDVGAATCDVPPEANFEVIDSRLLHMWEAKRALQKSEMSSKAGTASRQFSSHICFPSRRGGLSPCDELSKLQEPIFRLLLALGAKDGALRLCSHEAKFVTGSPQFVTGHSRRAAEQGLPGAIPLRRHSEMCSSDRHEWQLRRRLRLLLLKVVNLFRRESVSHSFRMRSFGAATSSSRVKVRGDPFSPRGARLEH